MADVSFEEERQYVIPQAKTERPGMTGWVVYYGLAKDEKQAQALLVGVAVAALLLSGAFLMFSSGSDTDLSSQEKLELERSTPLPSVRQ